MTEHSKLAPSSAARRVACPGSRALEALYPEDQQSPHAREGEAAHWLASQMILNCSDLTWRMPEIAPNGEMLTSDMVEGAQLYSSSVLTILRLLYGEESIEHLHIEEKIDISTIHPDCWGTPDCWLFKDRQLHIWDYKFGHGPVEVFENWQLIEYAAGILESLHINGIEDRYVQVIFYIIQPRSFHREGPIRRWEILASNLRGYFNILQDKERQASEENAPCFVSSECAYCLGRHACETLQRSSLQMADISLSNTPWELSPHSIGKELRYLKRAAELLEARITGLSEQATNLIRNGQRIPFFRLEQSLSREKWKVEPEEIIMLGEMLGCILEKPREVVTPKQAIKLGLPPEVVEAYTDKRVTGLKLVFDESNTARKIFGENNK